MLAESEVAVAAALEALEELTRAHPSLPAWLRAKQAALEVLTEQHEFLQRLGRAGERGRSDGSLEGAGDGG